MRRYSVAKSRAVPSTPTRKSSGSVSSVAQRSEDEPDDESEPDRLHRGVGGGLPLAGSEESCDGRGRAHREEDAERVAGHQDRGGSCHAGELGSAEVADDRGVGEDVEGLGDQREERGDRQREDLPVERRRSVGPAP